MTTTAPNKLSWVQDPSGVNNQVALVEADGNGGLAHVTSNWSLDGLSNAYGITQGHGGAGSVMKARWWQVGSSATTTSIPIKSLSGLSVNLSASTQSQWVGARFGISLGSTLCEAVVTAVNSSGTLTLDSALPSAPSAGTQFYLIPPEETQLTGSNMELYGKSTDTKPTTGLKVGTSFFEIDTENVYMWDGTTWEVL